MIETLIKGIMYIKDPLMLLSFLAILILLYKINEFRNRKAIINSGDEGNKTKMAELILNRIGTDITKLTKEKQYELTKTQLNHGLIKYIILVIAVLIVFFSILTYTPSKGKSNQFVGEDKLENLPINNDSNQDSQNVKSDKIINNNELNKPVEEVKPKDLISINESKQNSNETKSEEIFDKDKVEKAKKYISKLIKNITEVNNPNIKNGKTALIEATELGNIEAVHVLLTEYNAYIDTQDRNGKTALMYAVDKGHIDIAHMLVSGFEANINIQDNNGKTALIYALEKGYINIVQMLVAGFGADVNLQDKNGKTALMHASEKGYKNVVEMLTLGYEADIALKDKNGKTAMTYAIKNNNLEIMKLLKSIENRKKP